MKFLLALFPLAGILLLCSFFQKNPRVVLDTEFITAKYLTGVKTHDWSSISDVFLSRKEDYFTQSLEATVIVFDSQDKLVLMDDMFSNLAELRNFIIQKAAGKIRDAMPQIASKNLQTINRRIYSGNVFISMNNILMMGMAVAFMVMLRPYKFEPALFMAIGVLLFWYFVTGIQMNYFLIDEGDLFIKNHYFPWKNKRISLSDIEQVDFEIPYRSSTGLRIMSKDFTSTLYRAGTLKDAKWKELLNDLKFIGIPVRDDR
ncbi:MAG: hypothetical protein M3N30_05255 [Bacteroidota bacterium]|nr:hypothetical protein [Bacteroidota bacterium]